MNNPIKIDNERAMYRAQDMIDAAETPDLTFHDMCATVAYLVETMSKTYDVDRLIVTEEIDNFANQMFK